MCFCKIVIYTYIYIRYNCHIKIAQIKGCVDIHYHFPYSTKNYNEIKFIVKHTVEMESLSKVV